MGAIFKGEVQIARTLLAAHCSPDQRNGAGQTAAMYAGLFKRVELLDALKAQGADMNAEDPLGNSAARLASGEIRTAAPR
jgi:ankyrin repeat protein